MTGRARYPTSRALRATVATGTAVGALLLAVLAGGAAWADGPSPSPTDPSASASDVSPSPTDPSASPSDVSPSPTDTSASPSPSPTVPSPTPTPTPTPPPPPPPVPTSSVHVTLSPRAGSTVGVAYPVVAVFSTAVTHKADAERHMVVLVNGVRAPGAWYWQSSSRAIFRERTFWPGHRVVTVKLSLRGVVLAASRAHRWVGDTRGSRTHAFRTGRALVARVDDHTHRMTVTVDGRVVRRMGVSLGKAPYLTRSGVKVVTDKYLVRHMTSEGWNLPKAQQFDVMAPYAVRITPTGEFVHGAPWAVRRIGRYDGSHGCTNVRVADAKWFYQHSMLGDPVVTVGTARRMEPTNGLGGPWNLTWAQWLAGSALKGR